MTTERPSPASTPRTPLQTERLELRPLRPDDLEPLTLLHAEPSFWMYPLGRGQTREETEQFLHRVIHFNDHHPYGLQAVMDRQSGALAGWAGLSIPTFLPEILPAVEVGWRLGTRWRGRGLATEAGAAWVRWAFEVGGLDRLVSVYQPANEASGRVMDKLGFELERVTVQPGREIEVHVTSLTEQRWTARCAAGGWPS